MGRVQLKSVRKFVKKVISGQPADFLSRMKEDGGVQRGGRKRGLYSHGIGG